MYKYIDQDILFLKAFEKLIRKRERAMLTKGRGRERERARDEVTFRALLNDVCFVVKKIVISNVTNKTN